MATSIASQTLSANEAACVTGVPLKQVHRIIDAGLLGSAATNHKGSRAVLRDGLVGLKLAHETTGTCSPLMDAGGSCAISSTIRRPGRPVRATFPWTCGS